MASASRRARSASRIGVSTSSAASDETAALERARPVLRGAVAPLLVPFFAFALRVRAFVLRVRLGVLFLRAMLGAPFVSECLRCAARNMSALRGTRQHAIRARH